MKTSQDSSRLTDEEWREIEHEMPPRKAMAEALAEIRKLAEEVIICRNPDKRYYLVRRIAAMACYGHVVP